MDATNFVASATTAEYSRRLTAATVPITHRLLAIVLLVMFSPLIMVVTFLIWRTDGAPVLFGHYRVGRGGCLFKCLKFRSMRLDADAVLKKLLDSDPEARAEWARDHKLLRDPRVTGVGHFLRKTSLDELPQLFNVAMGDMRLVGPRPVTPPELTRYDGIRWDYVSVAPGMTGLWQVSGRNLTTYEQRVSLDQHYVETASAWLDIKILFRTIWVVLTGHGAR